jgi:hypothetical protein
MKKWRYAQVNEDNVKSLLIKEGLEWDEYTHRPIFDNCISNPNNSDEQSVFKCMVEQIQGKEKNKKEPYNMNKKKNNNNNNIYDFIDAPYNVLNKIEDYTRQLAIPIRAEKKKNGVRKGE